jgi:signal transduction histidine kinase
MAISQGTGGRDANRTGMPITGSRIALVAGFGGLLIMIALSGLDGLLVLQRIRSEDNSIRRQFLLRNHLLNDIRSELYLSGTWVRDYLLDPDPARASSFGTSLENVHGEMDVALASYEQLTEPREAKEYDELRAELKQYWNLLGPVLRWDADERRRRGYAFLRDEVFARRTAMLEIAGRIADINEEQLSSGNQRVVDLLTAFQMRLFITLAAVLTLGATMAAFTTRRILHLEEHAQARYLEVAEARRQLTDLSARLVETQETERRALARELHDEVGQSLSAALIELRNLSNAQAIGATGDGTGPRVESVRGLVEGTLKVVRNMSLLLRPSMLDDLGLIPALRWQAREVSRRTGLDVTVEADPESDSLPDEFKTCVYRVVQEALHNSERHSGAAAVRIQVERRPGDLLLRITDDGKGFDVARSHGLGLLGMEERAARLGGALRVSSIPGHGTTLEVELPFREVPV